MPAKEYYRKDHRLHTIIQNIQPPQLVMFLERFAKPPGHHPRQPINHPIEHCNNQYTANSLHNILHKEGPPIIINGPDIADIVQLRWKNIPDRLVQVDRGDIEDVDVLEAGEVLQ